MLVKHAFDRLSYYIYVFCWNEIVQEVRDLWLCSHASGDVHLESLYAFATGRNETQIIKLCVASILVVS